MSKTLDIPQDGWRWVKCENFCDPLYLCEMCGSEDHQYLNAMEHAEHATAYMCHDCVRKVWLRPQSWLAREWPRSKAGNEYINAVGFNTVIYKRKNGTGWGARIVEDHGWTPYGYDDQQDDDPIFLEAATSDGAKLAALEWLTPRIPEYERKEDERMRKAEEEMARHRAGWAAAETWLRQYLADGGKADYSLSRAMEEAGHSSYSTQAERNVDMCHRRDGTGYCGIPGIGEGTPKEMARAAKKRAEREERRKKG